MAQGINRQIILRSYPQGEPTPANFAVAESAIPEPGDGEVLLRNRYLSLDPYMRGRMSTARSYAKGFEIGQVLGGGTVEPFIFVPTLTLTKQVLEEKKAPELQYVK